MSSSTTRKRSKKQQGGADDGLNGATANGVALEKVALADGAPAQAAVVEANAGAAADGKMSKRDRNAIALLVVLYMLQGVPVGLAFGTMPFLLKTKLSYADIGTFMLATYPYSLKLAWSPIVDSCWVTHVNLPVVGKIGLGRRKSWIVPIQFIVGVMLWLLGERVDQLLLNDRPPVLVITGLFFTLVTFAATQDIAVDGWALTLLSQDNLSYASTAQTVGLNIGYFMSFTVFLALNSTEFSNKYLRSAAGAQSYPVLSLAAYLKIASLAFVLVTIWLALFKDENDDGEETVEKANDDDSPPSLEDKLGLRGAYEVMWKICKLRHVQTFLLIHLVAKIGFQANDAVTGLKLVEKGFSKEDLALTVLIDFPFQIVLGYLAARWSRGDKALTPWLWGYGARLGFAVLSMGIVYGLPSAQTMAANPSWGMAYFGLIIVSTVAGSFASTVQFVGISAFHTQIADPLIGGTYMTLLNTVSNLGGTWPSYFVLKAVDAFTRSECRVRHEDVERIRDEVKASSRLGGGEKAAEALLASLTRSGGDTTATAGAPSQYLTLQSGSQCATVDAAKQACLLSKGQCVTTQDGYYITSSVCVVIGLVILVTFILPQSRKLEKLGVENWRLQVGERDVDAEGDEGKKTK